MGKVVSKDEERKALANIKQIVADLGDNSYIAIAMDGIWEVIENNINDDFGYSHKNMIAYRDRQIDDLTGELKLEQAKVTKLVNDVKEKEAIVSQRDDRIMQLEATVASDNETIERLMKARDDMIEKLTESRANYEVLKIASDEKIVNLKAKLYDFMVKEEEGAK